MLLHFGFEKPTPEIMAKWQTWFESLADKQIEQGGFTNGREISKTGIKDLPWDKDCITGYNIIEAENFEEAEKSEYRKPKPAFKIPIGFRKVFVVIPLPFLDY